MILQKIRGSYLPTARTMHKRGDVSSGRAPAMTKVLIPKKGNSETEIIIARIESVLFLVYFSLIFFYI